MKVNAAKTAMLCMSDTMSYTVAGYIYDAEGNKIQSGETLKVLGFHFSSKPTMHAHVEALRKRFRRQYWSLYHLGRAGFSEDELARVYQTIMLPVADYCVAVYHPMLTDEQDQIIERLQSQALKIIYGPYLSYAEMRRRADATTLRERRIGICDKFAKKCLDLSLIHI